MTLVLLIVAISFPLCVVVGIVTHFPERESILILGGGLLSGYSRQSVIDHSQARRGHPIVVRFLLMTGALACSAATAQIVATNSALIVTRVALEEPAPTATTARVSAAAVSTSGERAAIGFSDGTIFVYSITAPDGVRPLIARTASVTVPDGRPAWVGSAREKWVAIFGRSITGLGFTSSGNLLASTGAGRILSITASGVTQRTTLVSHPIAVMSTNESGSRVLVGSERGRIAEIGATEPHADLRVLRAEAPGDNSVYDLRFVKGDAYVFSALEDYRLGDDVESSASGTKRDVGPTLWDPLTGVRVQRVAALQGSVHATAMRFSDRLWLSSDSGLCTTIDLNSPASPIRAAFGAADGSSCCPVGVLESEYLFAVGGPIWSVIHSESGAEVMKTTDGGLRTRYQAVLALPSKGRVLVVAKSGRCSIVQVEANFDKLSPIRKSQFLGTVAGRSIVLTHELPTSTSEIEEVAASVDGAAVAARDRKGAVVVWTKNGRSFKAAPLPLMVGKIPRTLQSLSMSRWGLSAVCDDGSVLHAAISPSISCGKREYLSDGRRVQVVSAFRYTETAVLLGLDDGSIVRADPTSGTVSDTIVAAGSTVGLQKLRYVGFHGDGAGRRVLAVPIVSNSESSRLKVIDLSDLKTVYDIPLTLHAARVAIDASGKAWISGSAPPVGVHCFDLMGSSAKIGYIHERCEWGLGFANSEFLFGMTKLHLHVTDLRPTPPVTTDIAIGIGPMRSLAQAPTDDAVFIALASGAVIRVAVQ